MANIWHEIKELIKLEDHSDRHEDGGADEISLAGLSGDPADTINESLLTTQNDIIVRGASIAERLNIAASRIVARLASGNVVGATGTQILALLTGQAGAAFSWNSKNLTNTGTITAATSVWHHEHDLFATSLNPGASGATRTAPDSNTIGGWQLNAAGETLYFEAHMEAEWDAVSDLIVNAWWEVNVDNTGGAGGDTVDLQLVTKLIRSLFP